MVGLAAPEFGSDAARVESAPSMASADRVGAVMRWTRSVAFVGGLAAMLTVGTNIPAAADLGTGGSGGYCAGYDAYELHDCGPQHRLPAGALGEQLGWVLRQLGGGASTLTVEEVREHLTAAEQQVRPAEEVLGGLRQTLTEVGPLRLLGYSYPPRTDQALAVGRTGSGRRLAVSIGVAAGRIDILDVTDPPPTLVPRGRYHGWYAV